MRRHTALFNARSARRSWCRSWCQTVLGALLIAALAGGAVITSAAPLLTYAAEDDTAAITDLVAQMEAAILAQDAAAYLALVDLSDPIFALEHTRWVEDWDRFDEPDRLVLDVAAIDVAGDTARANLVLKWALERQTSIRVARFPARFTRAAAGWRYAGEDWQTLAGDRFQVHAFAGYDDAMEHVAALMPGIWEYATARLDYEPDAIIHVKLYPDRDTLGASIALSLPPIAGWNEPGESLKLLSGELGDRLDAVLAHELTHFLTFEMAGTSHGTYPWWLMEGVAEYVASGYWPDGAGDERVQSVARAHLNRGLPAWEQISNFEETPNRLWRYVYPMGYAFVRYVVDAYSEAALNAWIGAMADGAHLDVATEVVFEITFEALDAGFEAWLAERIAAS